MNALLLQPKVACSCELQEYVPATEIVRSSRYRLSNSALAVALKLDGRLSAHGERNRREIVRLVRRVLLVEYCGSTCAASLVRVVGLLQLDREDLARLADLPRSCRPALRVKAVPDAVGNSRVDPPTIRSVLSRIRSLVGDRGRPCHVQVRLDRMLEPLGVAVVGRVPDTIEDRPGQLRLKDRRIGDSGCRPGLSARR